MVSSLTSGTNERTQHCKLVLSLSVTILFGCWFAINDEALDSRDEDGLGLPERNTFA
jgi:hypothetical protein